MAKIRMVSGEIVDAKYVEHLRTLTDGGKNMDVDLYEHSGIRLVCTSPENDRRIIPDVDPDSTPADYGR